MAVMKGEAPARIVLPPERRAPVSRRTREKKAAAEQVALSSADQQLFSLRLQLMQQVLSSVRSGLLSSVG